MNEDILQKYRQRIARELKSDYAQAGVKYSDEYKTFKAEQLGKARTFYEQACNYSEKLFRIKIAQADVDKITPAIRLAHLAITPEGVFSFTYLAVFATIVLSFILFAILWFNPYIIIIGLITAVSLLFYLPSVPKKILTSWRARASDQLVLAVLYVVIYMQHTPNLERAIKFVAEHLPPPLSMDFIKILWDVESKTYTSVTEALEDYAVTWKDVDNDFIESMHLIQASLYEPSAERKKQILDEAVKVILDGTQDHMLTFAHQLQSPMEALHMLGVVLPVMGLVMLPMISAFMGADIKWYYIVGLYNFVLPLAIYGIGKSVLSTRPAGSDMADVYLFMKAKYKSKKDQNLLLSVLAGLLIMVPGIIYFAKMFTLSGDAFRKESFSMLAIFSSIDIVLALGLAFGLYYYMTVKDIIKVKKQIEGMELEFASAIFQLGEKLQERKPPEQAIIELANTVKAADVAKFFQIIVTNITQLGYGLKDAVFDEKSGALSYYPSSTIKSAMALFVEGVKKGPEIAGSSLLIISEYLRTVKKVTDRMKDLLADTVSSMSSQVTTFIPVISGIVIGLAVLTSTVLLNLGEQIKSATMIGEGAGGQAAGVGSIADIFQIDSMLPSPLFQFTVGIYILQLVWLLSYMLSGIIYGHDEVELRWMMAKNFLIATVLYVVITSITVLLFSALAAPITQLSFAGA